MANQYVNKVIVNNKIKMDLTEDTITPKTLRKGFTAHDASGAPIVGNESLTDISEDGTDAGPIAELTANGWANQTQLTGKNLLDIATKYNSTDFFLSNGVLTNTRTDSWTLLTPQIQFFNGNTSVLTRKFIGDAIGTVTVNIPENATSVRLKHNGESLDLKIADVALSDIGVKTGDTITASFKVIANNPSIAGGMVISDIQLELGSTATEYEPYCGGIPSSNPNYPQEIRVARGRNLLQNTAMSKTINGVTFTVNEDGSVTANGTASVGTSFDIATGLSFESGTYTLSCGNTLPSGVNFAIQTSGGNKLCGTYGSITFSESISGKVWIYLSSGATVSNLIFYPQLELGSVATPYIPYGFVGVEAQGKNLFGSLINKTLSGNSTGGYGLNNTGGTSFVGTVKPNTTYTVCDHSTTVGTRFRIVGFVNDSTLPASTNAFEIVSDPTISPRQYTFNSGNANYVVLTIDHATYYPEAKAQLELGSEATEYEPYYHKTIPIPLPSKGFAAALPDGTHDILHLDGAGGYTWVENTAEKVYDGSESWSKGNGFTYTAKPSDCAETGDGLPSINKLMMDRFKVSYSQQEGAVYASGVNLLFWCGDSYNPSSAEEAKSWATSNPITLLYPLATPQTEQGYVEVWDNDFPLGCTIDIPELRNLNVEYFLYDCITQLADDYYDRTTNDISEAMSQTSDNATHEALAAIAPIEGDISSANYAVGSYLIHDGKLCEVTTVIAANEAIVVGTNVVISSVATEVNELQEAIDDINNNPYILPTMSESTKGGAKVGQGLRIDDDILSVDMSSSQATDAGPLISLQAEGWAEQTQLTGKNLARPNPEITDATQTGLTWTNLGNGVWKVVGTNSSSDSTTARSFKMFELGILPAGTYVTKFELVSGTCDKVIIARFGTGSNAAYYNSTTTVEMTSEVCIRTFVADGSTQYWLAMQFSAGSTVNGVFRLQVETGSTPTSYEPYCGGIPSPNPDYSQDIRVAKGRNLLPKMTSGSYYTVNDDNSVTITQAVESNTYFMSPYTIDVKAGETYTLSGSTSAFYTYMKIDGTNRIAANGPVTFTPLEDASVNIVYVVMSTVSVGATIHPQLKRGSVATPYVPYGYLGCEVQSRNLLHNTATSQTINGVTFTVNSDGTVTCNGTASANAIFQIIGSEMLENGTYTMSGCPSGGSGSTYELQCTYDSITYRDYGSGKQFTTTSSSAIHAAVGIIVRSGYTCNNVIFKPQFELGSVAHEYEPYIHKTIPIPLPSKGFAAALPDGTSDILRLDGAGKWEWESNTQETTFDGSETWTLGNNGARCGTTVTDIAIAKNASEVVNGYADRFIAGSPNNTYVGGKAITNDIGQCFSHNVTLPQLWFSDGTGAMTVADFKTWLQSNPVKVLYQLANPITEQGYLDNWDNSIPLHATIDIPELRNIGVECYMDEQASTLNVQWSERLRSEMDDTSTNAVTESLASLAPVEGDISSANYSTGSYLIHNNQLYKVTNPIATGETISTSTNVTAVTLSDDVKYLNDHPYILPTMSEDTKGGAKVGHGLNVENDILSIGGVNDPTDAGPIVELSAKGLAEQNGTPSPDSPVDIEVVRGRNLLPCVVATTTNNGITFTVNSDGTIVANGTVSYSYATLILLNATKLQSLPVIGKSVTLTLSGCPAGGGSSTYQLIATLGDDGTTIILADNDAGITRAFTNMQCPSAGNVYIRIYGNGRTVNNLVFKPQLEIGSVATPYVPHGYIGVDVQNKNLCPVPKQQTIVSNGVTFTVNDDGSVNVVGETSNAYASCTLDEKFILGAGTYTISGVNGNVIFEIREDFSDGTYTFYNTTNTKTITLDHDAYINRMYLVVIPDKTVNTTVYPQLEKASTATSYEPYHHQTIPIPLPERGWVASLPDGTSDILYLDGAGGYTWELNTNEVLLDGLIACDYISASTVHTDALRARVAAVTGTPSRNAYNGRSSHFTSGSTASWANMGVGQFYLDGSGVILGMPIATIDTTENVTAWLQSNPVTILYALTTPQTESGYVDMPTIPAHATLSTELTGLTVRCCADAGAAEISQAWAKRFKMELDELREIVNGLT